jgi:hypothetical protein
MVCAISRVDFCIVVAASFTGEPDKLVDLVSGDAIAVSIAGCGSPLTACGDCVSADGDSEAGGAAQLQHNSSKKHKYFITFPLFF